MGRAPCCEKMGVKKGPWDPEEDQILVNYIRQHGHNNWRALPKEAGLLRCGKSCRLRWTNYLRPDIKRGNFSQHEEQTIINLHQMLGNRWSAIAAKLPGRTDNEIKNVWHTHLKKRLPRHPNQPGNNSTATTATTTTATYPTGATKKKRAWNMRTTKEGVVPKKRVVKHEKHVVQDDINDDSTTNNNINNDNITSNSRPTKIVIKTEPFSPQPCTSEVSTVTSASENDNSSNSKENVSNNEDYVGDFPEINDDFWMEVLSIEDTAMSTEDLPSDSTTMREDLWLLDPMFESKSSFHKEEMDVFWYNLLSKPIDLPELSDML